MEKKKTLNNLINKFLIIGLIPLSYLIMLECLLLFNGIYEQSFWGILNDIVLVTLFFGVFTLISSNKVRKIFVTIFFVLLSLILIGDSIYYGFYKSFASINSFIGIKNLGKNDLGIKVMLSTVAIIIVSVSTIILIWVGNNKTQWFKLSQKLAFLLVFAFGVGNLNGLAFYIIKHRVYESKLEYYSSNTFLYNTFYSSNRYTQKFGYINFRIRDIAVSLEVTETAEVNYEDINNLFLDRDKKQSNEVTSILEGYNIITLMCETFDTRFVSSEVTPNLVKLMYTDSITFPNYYVPTFFEGATINTEFMTLNSLYPITTSMWASNLGDQYSNNYFKDFSLPGQLNKAGYDTYYFHNNTKSFYSREKLIANYGFKYMYFQEEIVEAGFNKDNLDTNLINYFNTFIDTDELFYVNCLTYSNHLGNDEYYKNISYEYINSLYPELLEDTKIYLCKLIEFDTFIGLLMDWLIENDLYENTALFMYPDHYNYGVPTVYNDLGIDVNSPDKIIHNQELTLFVQGEARVKLDKLINSKTIDNLGCSIDLAPTILNLVGSEFNFDYFLGKDIFDNDSIILFSDYTLFDGVNFISIDTISEDDVLFDKFNEELELIELSKIVLRINFFDYFNKTVETDEVNSIVQTRFILE